MRLERELLLKRIRRALPRLISGVEPVDKGHRPVLGLRDGRNRRDQKEAHYSAPVNT
jgi:hypothetical protein